MQATRRLCRARRTVCRRHRAALPQAAANGLLLPPPLLVQAQGRRVTMGVGAKPPRRPRRPHRESGGHAARGPPRPRRLRLEMEPTIRAGAPPSMLGMRAGGAPMLAACSRPAATPRRPTAACAAAAAWRPPRPPAPCPCCSAACQMLRLTATHGCGTPGVINHHAAVSRAPLQQGSTWVLGGLGSATAGMGAAPRLGPATPPPPLPALSPAPAGRYLK